MIEQDGTPVRTGSGVIIGRRPLDSSTDRYVLTASHVVTGLPDGQIYALLERHRGGPGRRTRATLLAHRDSDRLDAALLKIQPEAGCVAAEFGNAPALGDDILAFGFPWGRAMTLASGIVSQVPLEESDARLMIDASVSYGVSGGDVYDARGRLIGIVEGYRTAQVSYRDGDKDKDSRLAPSRFPCPAKRTSCRCPRSAASSRKSARSTSCFLGSCTRRSVVDSNSQVERQ